MQNIKPLQANKKFDIKRIIYILSFSILLALIYNTFSVDGISYIRTKKSIETLKSIDIIDETDSSKTLKAISLPQAIEIFNNKKALFIDARDQWDFKDAHIKGALNIPEFSFNPNNRTLAQISKNEILIIYCSGNDCSVSQRLASKLIKLGYKKVYVYLGGFTEWQEAKLPIEKKKETANE